MPFTIPSKRLRPLLLAASALTLAFLSYFRAFELYEFQTYDWRCRLRGPRAVHPDIVFIDIWDDTVKELGAWPFDRGNHAALIDVLHAHGVKALAFDVNFVERRAGDDLVYRAAKRADNVYFVTAFSGIRETPHGFVADKEIAPLRASYARSAKGIGIVNVRADIDGKRRKVFPRIDYRGKPHYQLSFRIAMDLFGVKPEDVRLRPGRSLEFPNGLSVPLDEEGFFIVSYAGIWEKTFKHYSYYDVLVSYVQGLKGEKPLINLEELRGKVCFVGLTTTASHDTNPIPIESVYPQVGVHANILNDLLMKDFIRRLHRIWNALLVLVLAGLIAFLSVRLRPMKALGAATAVLAVYAGAVIGAFVWAGWWVDLFFPCTAFIVTYAAATLARTLHEMRKRELIEGELKIASQIQRSFLPETVPQEKGIEIAVFMRPAKAVGGDLYAFLTLGDGRLGVMAGDVSGKGPPAALFMAKIVSEFKFSARGKDDPAEALAALNDSISAESTGGLFVTLCYAIFDLPRRKLFISNGGHLPLVVTRGDGKREQLMAEEGMPIGVMPGVTFATLETSLGPGDCFAFYSDGVSEARNKRKDEYGVEALEKGVSDARALPAQGVLDENVKRLVQFMGKADQHDDITLIIAKITEADGL